MSGLPDNFSREDIERTERLFDLGPDRLSLPYEYGRTREYHEEFGRAEARPGRRKTSRRRHTVRAVRVPLVQESQEVPYVYRGSLVGEVSSPAELPDGWNRPQPRPAAPEPPRTTPAGKRPPGPDGTMQVTRSVSHWTGLTSETAYEVRPTVRSGFYHRVETDADPATGRATFVRCSCSERVTLRGHLCDHARLVLRLIRDGVKIGRDYS